MGAGDGRRPAAPAGGRRPAVRHGDRQNVDLVVASRYAGHGSAGGLDGAGRRSSSRLATRIAKLAFPRRAGAGQRPDERLLRRPPGRARPRPPPAVRLQDPARARSSGRRGCAPPRSASRFAPRYAGESKTSFREVLRFGRHLARLRLQLARERSSAVRREPPRLRSRIAPLRARRACPGSSSTRPRCGCCSMTCCSCTTWSLRRSRRRCPPCGTSCSPTALVFRSQRGTGGWGRMWRFFLMNNLALLLRLPAARAARAHRAWRRCGRTWSRCVALFAVRYVISDRLIFGRPVPAVSPEIAPPAGRAGEAPGRPRRRRLDGRPRAAQAHPLPALPLRRRAAWSRSARRSGCPSWSTSGPSGSTRDMDIAVRVGDVGRGRPLGRAVVTAVRQPAGAALRGAPRPARRQLPDRPRLHHRGDGRPAAGPLAARRLHQHPRGAAAVRGRRPRAGCCCTRPASSSTATGSCCPPAPTPGRPARSSGCCASRAARSSPTT